MDKQETHKPTLQNCRQQLDLYIRMFVKCMLHALYLHKSE
jgi:hypothetical protein